MTSKKSVPTSPEGKFGKQLEDLISSMISRMRFVVPIFTADPPETDPTNLWMRYDGRLRGRVPNGVGGYTYYDYPMRTDITSPPAVPVYPGNPSTATPVQSYVKTWDANFSQTYLADTNYRPDHDGDIYAIFGTDSTYGDQRAIIGWDYTDIANSLAGSTIQSIELTMTALRTYYTDGTQMAIGMHNEGGFVSNYSATSTIMRYGDLETVVPGQSASYSLPLSFAQAFRAGTAKGIVLEAPNAATGMLGAVASIGSGYTPPQLTITYAK